MLGEGDGYTHSKNPCELFTCDKPIVEGATRRNVGSVIVFLLVYHPIGGQVQVQGNGMKI